MDDIEKLSCKEELDISDIEHSATDDHKDTEEKPKKKKRRRREIDMIKLSEDEDSEDEGSGKRLRPSPGPNSPAAHREPRTCVLKASQKRRPLSRLLEQLLRNLEKRDPHQFFAWPVNDTFAPNYSNVIRKPMDFSTIKQKIDDNVYRSLNCFISDFKLMCNNAMKYNKPGTVYHKAAKRLMHGGLRQLAPAKLRPLAEILTYMYEIPIRELGFDIGKMDVHKVLKRRPSGLSSGAAEGTGGSEGEREEDQDQDHEQGDALGRKIAMEARREMHRRKLAKKAFPRMDSSGLTTLRLVTAPVEPAPPGASQQERPVTIGQLLPRLTHGTGSLHTSREDRRNTAKPVKPLNYGPFASFAPAYDSTFATLTKDETHLLLHTLPYETGAANQEILRFAADSPWRPLYDMEAMFPARPQPHQPPPQEDLSKVKIDVSELKSLTSLGIDTDFLTDLEDEIEAAQRDLGLQPALAHTADLIAKLEREQTHRLSLPPPWHLSLVPKASTGERELARMAASCLRAMAARLKPSELAPTPAVRAAMGVTLHHLDTPLAVDELDEGELSGREGSDIDSRDSHDK